MKAIWTPNGVQIVVTNVVPAMCDAGTESLY